MKLIIERHAFAPELNKVHIVHRGRIVAALAAPNARTIKEARRMLFAPITPCIMAVVEKQYCAPYDGLNHTWRGIVGSRKEALDFMRAQQVRNPGNVKLNNGAFLPRAYYSAATRLGAQHGA